jgi:hypothetical protein
MKQISVKWLQDQGACGDGITWFEEQKETGIKVVAKLIAEEKLDWANWLIVRIMGYKQYVSYAVYAAEQVKNIFENRCPDDKRTRLAIEAAKKCLKNPSAKNKAASCAAGEAASCAAGEVASCAAGEVASREVASRAACYAACYAASCAASCAASRASEVAIRAASYAVCYAASCAASCAASEAASCAASRAMKLKILNYGLQLLTGGKI